MLDEFVRSALERDDGITRIAATGMPNNTVRVPTVIPGLGFWDRTCNTAGTWSGATKIATSETLFDVSSAGTPSGDLRVAHVDYSG